MTPDILVASAQTSSAVRPVDLSVRHRKASLSALVSGRIHPAQITIIDAKSSTELKNLGRLAAKLKPQLQAADTNFLILVLDSPNQDEKVRLFRAFDHLDRVEISDAPGMVDSVLDNVLAKIKVRTEQHAVSPRPSPLDSISDVVSVTGFLREPNGKLSAEKISVLYGVSLAQLAAWLGRSRQTLCRTPDADAIQDKLSYFERVARLLKVLPEEDFRKWLRMPNPNLEQDAPLRWMASRKWQAIADLVDDMLTGAPT